MINKRDEIINHIKLRLSSLEELGKNYSDEKINKLADKLLSTNKPLDVIKNKIDNEFSNQVRKVNHNSHLASLKEYYIASIDKLSKNNNYYLLSYHMGEKILEQAFISDEKVINDDLVEVKLNKKRTAYKKHNSTNNDYELIMSDMAYILNIPYAKTYRIFNKDMEPEGTLNESLEIDNKKFLSLEDTLQFVLEESSKFTKKNTLKVFHDKCKKKGIINVNKLDDIKKNIDYVLNLFSVLPDITKDNLEKIKRQYLNYVLFELLTNNIKNDLTNIGLLIDKSSLKYTYELSLTYNKCNIILDLVEDDEVLLNFYIVNKGDLISVLLDSYYKYTKELFSMIVDNQNKLIKIFDEVIKEHLEYEDYNLYHRMVTDNIMYITEGLNKYRVSNPVSEEDKTLFEDNNMLFNNRVMPLLDNYDNDNIFEDNRGSTIIVGVVAFILTITILLILFAIYSIIKLDM